MHCTGVSTATAALLDYLALIVEADRALHPGGTGPPEAQGLSAGATGANAENTEGAELSAN
eukprot:m.112236 g.112236  ORF g.112236 m.112236 type:complete len:61 (-) comp12963_c0_seq5:2094-2276(-)